MDIAQDDGAIFFVREQCLAVSDGNSALFEVHGSHNLLCGIAGETFNLEGGSAAFRDGHGSCAHGGLSKRQLVVIV